MKSIPFIRIAVAGGLLLAGLLALVTSGQSQTIRERMRQRREARKGDTSTPQTADARPAASCSSGPNVGFRIVSFGSGKRAAVWYPSLAAEKSVAYANGLSSGVAENATVADCGSYPLVVFSHGFGGCGTQSVFVTEAVARHGYIVAAPDHKDAGCKVDEPKGRFKLQRAETPFRQPEKWSDKNYADRRDDIRALIDQLPRMSEFSGRIDTSKIAGMGHSLGGYTMMGMAGGWNSWKDSRLKALVLFSPYAAPYLEQNKLSQINVPVMYQGGERDFGITPGLRKAGGVYDKSNAPKYFLELKQQGHLDWTVKACQGDGTVENCLNEARVKTVTETAITFLDRYVKGSGAASRPTASTSGDLRAAADASVVADFRAQAN
jgi:predicted dienelactone hydrolase